jgi:hypothetical protein
MRIEAKGTEKAGRSAAVVRVRVGVAVQVDERWSV